MSSGRASRVVDGVDGIAWGVICGEGVHVCIYT